MLLLVFLGFSGFCDCSFRPCFNLVDRLEKTYSTDFYASVAYTSGAEVLGPIPTEGALPFAASDKAGAQLSYQGGEEMSVVYHQGRGACIALHRPIHRVKPVWPTGPWKQWKISEA
jgi:hypothetical protein